MLHHRRRGFAGRTPAAPIESLEPRVLLASDFGDAPNMYGTSGANAASHTIVAGFFLGASVDAEADGQPAINADGDDLAGTDDEDGVTIPTLTAGESAQVSIVVSLPAGMASATVSSFVDWNRDGDFFDAGEAIAPLNVNAGTNLLTLAVPATATVGQTYARFRLAATTVGATLSSISGEVEDYRVTINPGTDFGDAPNTYGTSGANAASHTRVSGFYLGSTVDGELDGQPTANADGDDLNGIDDEDGVTLPAFTAGEPAQVPIVVHLPATMTTATVSSFFDWNGDGDFFDAGESLSPLNVNAGTNTLNVLVPANAIVGQTYARFRLASTTVGATLSATGGEVEDYRLSIAPGTDFGDAPSSYGTAGANAASHSRISGFYLGATVDGELDGQPTANANGDDLNGVDDEDGVTIPSSLTAGEPTQITLTVHLPAGMTTATVSSFIDWNGDGDFFDAGEALTALTVSAGTNTLNVLVPANAIVGQTYARFRLASTTVGATLSATGGEVEDYRLSITPGTDFGDAPSSYGTAGANAASHTRVSGFYLGSSVDGELDGQPSVNADGDDLAGSDDEDGVTFPILTAGEPAQIPVVAHLPAGMTTATVSAFIDWNADGDFFDAGEALTALTVNAGTNTLNVLVPANAVVGQTYARFRLASTTVGATLSATGGEVEDYRVAISPGTDFGDAPSSYGTSGANAASHTRVSGFYLGSSVDGETDGQPGANADGDDTHGIDDDEDGVTIPPLTPGQPAQIPIVVHLPPGMTTAMVSSFVDWNGDGDFFDAGEALTPLTVNAGTNTLNVAVPANAVTQTYARFRLASTAVGSTLATSGGEVEDYRISSAPVSFVAPGAGATWNAATQTLTVTGPTKIISDPGSDGITIEASGGAAVLTIDAGPSSVLHIGALHLSNGASATFVSHGTAGESTLIANGNPTIDATSKLDLADNAMVIKSGSAAGVQAAVSAAFNHGAWNGVGGITSSAAAADSTGLTAVGYASNADLGRSSFAGVSGLTANDVLVKYTYYGDADLNGRVTLDDFTQFLHGYQNAGNNWLAGDFDFNGKVTLDDFTQFLFSYQNQGGAI